MKIEKFWGGLKFACDPTPSGFKKRWSFFQEHILTVQFMTPFILGVLVNHMMHQFNLLP